MATINIISKLNELLIKWEQLVEEIKYYEKWKFYYRSELIEKRKELRKIKQQYKYYKNKKLV